MHLGSIRTNSNDVTLLALNRIEKANQLKGTAAIPAAFRDPNLSIVAPAQTTPPAPATWPGPGQLFVGTCYQPIERTPEQIDQDIARMKRAG
jgi:hypothetical protein